MRSHLVATVLGGLLLISACTATRPEPPPVPSRPSPPVVTTTTPAPTTTSSPPVVTTTTPPPQTSEPADVAEPLYSCEPTAPAKFEDPNNPNIITNKNCPELNAERSRAQRAYAEQLEREAAESRATMTDANGETYEEYCARTGQPLNDCAAG